MHVGKLVVIIHCGHLGGVWTKGLERCDAAGDAVRIINFTRSSSSENRADFNPRCCCLLEMMAANGDLILQGYFKKLAKKNFDVFLTELLLLAILQGLHCPAMKMTPFCKRLKFTPHCEENARAAESIC